MLGKGPQHKRKKAGFPYPNIKGKKQSGHARLMNHSARIINLLDPGLKTSSRLISISSYVEFNY